MKNILITGATGFLGKNLKELFLSSSVLTPTRSELNLLDIENVKRYFKANQVGFIIHAAGNVGGIMHHKKNPATIMSENLQMGINLIDVAAKDKVKKIIFISTVCVYPEIAQLPIKEDSLYHGYPAFDTSFYGIAKRTLKTLLDAYRIEFDLNAITIIPTNLYGPHDYYDNDRSHVVAALLKRFHDAKLHDLPEVVIWGDGSQVRDFLYVKDCAYWIKIALESCVQNEILNFGSSKGTTIQELVELISEIVGYTGSVIWDKTKPIGAQKRLLDIRNSKKKLGYTPLTNLRDGLIETYEYFKKNEI